MASEGWRMAFRIPRYLFILLILMDVSHFVSENPCLRWNCSANQSPSIQCGVGTCKFRIFHVLILIPNILFFFFYVFSVVVSQVFINLSVFMVKLKSFVSRILFSVNWCCVIFLLQLFDGKSLTTTFILPNFADFFQIFNSFL